MGQLCLYGMDTCMPSIITCYVYRRDWSNSYIRRRCSHATDTLWREDHLFWNWRECLLDISWCVHTHYTHRNFIYRGTPAIYIHVKVLLLFTSCFKHTKTVKQMLNYMYNNINNNVAGLLWHCCGISSVVAMAIHTLSCAIIIVPWLTRIDQSNCRIGGW